MINVIADRYAQALFEVGEETQTTSELYQELSELVDIFNENKDLYNFLKSPLIGREDKQCKMPYKTLSAIMSGICLKSMKYRKRLNL